MREGGTEIKMKITEREQKIKFERNSTTAVTEQTVLMNAISMVGER